MAHLKDWILPVGTMVGIGGLVYYLLSLRDTTPVGLTIIERKTDSNAGIQNGDDMRLVEVIKGTYRESESSLPIRSDDSNSILIVYDSITDNSVKTVAHVERISDSNILVDYLKGEDVTEDDIIKVMKKMRSIFQNMGEDTTGIDAEIQQLENTEPSSAEMNFRASNTLQSHFVW